MLARLACVCDARCLPHCLRRAVLLDGLRLLVPTAHSVLLCFMVGPLGLLSHLLTRALVHWQRKDNPATASSSMWS